MGRIRLASYNVHRGVGRDRRCDPRRILGVLREIDADVYALQEVEAHDDGGDMLEWLGRELGYHAIAGTTLKRHDGHFGNGILSRCPAHGIDLVDLSWRRREPRGAIAADIDCDGQRLRVVATHLGLRPAERREQVERLLRLFSWKDDDRAVLMGDLNEWFLWGKPLRHLHRYFERTRAIATFPSRRPVLALDRLWAHPGSILKELTAHSSELARVASDHLPLVATLEL
ncbi:MAG TPA: endonuclease/exonuclease/phosphatase family protein [Usitatibacter sp.]|jgi:endonuclease/exonuclease/phosphatase family metal-dependent hydrolase|nr:endonuclease/exonuclease/phosphatase family protein [Usitatibacter sp.]